MEKATFRKRIKEKINALSTETLKHKSCEIQKKVLGLEIFRQAQVILGYAALPDEVDTQNILDDIFTNGKTLLLPRSETDGLIIPRVVKNLKTDVSKGQFDILEPKRGNPFPLNRIDLILVPGRAFDRNRFRLGRGKGFYDRFLSDQRLAATTVGLAFQLQVGEKIPISPHDRKLDIVVTEKEVLMSL